LCTTSRWPFKLVAALNSYKLTLLHEKLLGEDALYLYDDRGAFLRKLIEDLLSPVIEKRSTSSRSVNLLRTVKSAMQTMGYPVPVPEIDVGGQAGTCLHNRWLISYTQFISSFCFQSVQQLIIFLSEGVRFVVEPQGRERMLEVNAEAATAGFAKYIR